MQCTGQLYVHSSRLGGELGDGFVKGRTFQIDHQSWGLFERTILTATPTFIISKRQRLEATGTRQLAIELRILPLGQ